MEDRLAQIEMSQLDKKKIYTINDFFGGSGRGRTEIADELGITNELGRWSGTREVDRPIAIRHISDQNDPWHGQGKIQPHSDRDRDATALPNSLLTRIATGEERL